MSVIAVCFYICSFAILGIGSRYEKACVRLVMNDTGNKFFYLHVLRSETALIHNFAAYLIQE